MHFLTTTYDVRLLIAAVCIGLFVSFIAIRLFINTRASYGSTPITVLTVGSLLLGCGIWTADLTAIMSFNFGLQVGYDAALLGGTLIFAIAIGAACLALVIYYPSQSMFGGAVLGLGIACLNYLSMKAIQTTGDLNHSFLVALLGAAVATLIGVTAIKLATTRKSVSFSLVAAGLLSFAILLQHLITASATEVVPDLSRHIAADSISSAGLVSAVATVNALMGISVLWRSDFVLGNLGDRISGALDNLSVGLLIFDGNEDLLVCNKPYREIYNVPLNVVRPGHGTLTDLLKYRTGNGTFREDPEQYLINLRAALARGGSTHREPKLADGRTVSVWTHPMVGGGWVAIHENISERRQAEEERSALAVRDQRRIYIENAIASFRERMSNILASVIESSASTNATASEMVRSSTKTSQSAEAALDSSSEASAGADTASHATQELNASIAEINKQLRLTTDVVGAAVNKAAKMNSELLLLEQATAKIDEVVKLIQHIASQTNLLALNATIEAARAGDAGRGFSVVATEVKVLSVQTAKATNDIVAQVAALQASGGRVVDEVRQIIQQLNEINVYSSEAAAAVTHQNEATGEISRSVTAVAQGTNDVVSVLHEVTKDAQQTIEAAQTVQIASGHVETKAKNLIEEVNVFLEKVAS
jgi:methyl-accepting chemotaxis protein